VNGSHVPAQDCCSFQPAGGHFEEIDLRLRIEARGGGSAAGGVTGVSRSARQRCKIALFRHHKLALRQL
jgi:hypothetical protein